MYVLKVLGFVLLTGVAIVIALPFSWLFFLLAPVVMLMVSIVLVVSGLFGSMNDAKPAVLVISNNLTLGEAMKNALGSHFEVVFKSTSIQGITELLRRPGFEYVFLQWQRKALAGEAILDFLDLRFRYQKKVDSHWETPTAPVIFLKDKSESRIKARIDKKHSLTVKKFIEFDSEHYEQLGNDVRNAI